MLLQKDTSCLLLIDVQEKLTPLVLHAKELISRCEWLLQLANELEVPILVSEQYPKGLGGTLESLKQLASPHPCIEKTHFSACGSTEFLANWKSLGKNQAVIIGIEAHVCVLQTALDLLQQGVEVFIVTDAVSSRHEIDLRYALKRMKQQGASLVTAEMVFFEWIRKAGTPEFKNLSQTYLRKES